MILRQERSLNNDVFFCKGDMKESTTTHFAELEKCIVIIKNVPCTKCTQCGEVVYSGTVIARLEKIIDELSGILTEIAVVNYSDQVA